MAAQKREVNKSAAVRDALATNPNTPVKEIVSALATQGIKVTDGLVYNIKSHVHNITDAIHNIYKTEYSFPHNFDQKAVHKGI